MSPGMSFGRAAAAALLACLASGCLSAPLPRDLPSRPGLPESLDLGFDPADPLATARLGDRVVIEVRAVTRGGPLVRYVDLELVGGADAFDGDKHDVLMPSGYRNAEDRPVSGANVTTINRFPDWVIWATASAVLRVTTLDGEGEALATRRVAIQQLSAAALGGDPVREEALSPGVHDLLRLVLTVPELDAMLQDVAKRPPLWTLLNGLSIGLEFRPETARPLGNGLVGIDAGLTANGSPALEGSLHYGAKASPYLITAGARRIDARHPTRPELRVALTLVAARRGDGEPLPTGPAGPFFEDGPGRVRLEPPTGPVTATRKVSGEIPSTLLDGDD